MSIFEKLNEDRVFYSELSEDKKILIITEACEDYFSSELTKAEVAELAAKFLEISKEMIG